MKTTISACQNDIILQDRILLLENTLHTVEGLRYTIHLPQSTRVSVPSSELSPPSPSPASECVPPWNQKGGGMATLAGSQFGRLERKPGTVHTKKMFRQKSK
jgi:hypothetical protein